MNGIQFLNSTPKEKNYIFIGSNYLSKLAINKFLGSDYKVMETLPKGLLFKNPLLVKNNEELQNRKYDTMQRNYKYVIQLDKADKRKKLFKSAPKNVIINFIDISEEFLQEQIKTKLNISIKYAKKLCNYCNNDSSKIYNELNKLKWLDNKTVLKYITNLVIHEDKEIFTFLNQLFKGSNYFNIYERLEDNELKILFMIQKQLKGMIICKDLITSANNDIAGRYNLHPYQVKIYKELSNNFSIE
ncbi:MAG: hypothetical protein ACOC1K_06075, partial [Nanoarchaeota archaeon]